jgi:hypothetical protein
MSCCKRPKVGPLLTKMYPKTYDDEKRRIQLKRQYWLAQRNTADDQLRLLAEEDQKLDMKHKRETEENNTSPMLTHVGIGIERIQTSSSRIKYISNNSN